VSYRTADNMLASVQDYHPGQPGSQELIWQATLGPSAVVFTSHPACSADGAGTLPGYWVGNAVLPRAAQWKSTLVAIYDLPEEDWMGFTHACFPTPAFDEYALRDNWAFARKGNGYLAVSSSLGLELVTKGEHAFHELRSPGRRPVWSCEMGGAASDGDFISFQGKILGLSVQYDGLSVDYTTPQGDRISFGYHQPLLVNEENIPLSGYPHYENPFTITPLNSGQMDIQYGETVLRLDFQSPPAMEP
jgi:hypothetical protein